MAGETTLTIIGNLTDRPDLRITQGGVPMCRFTVASTSRTFDKKSNEWRDSEPLFMTCTAWRDLAEHVAESLDKGARVVVVGRLRLSKWETPDGEKRSMMQLDADEVGPSLRFATARINKINRSGPAPSTDDAWTSATPATRATAGEPTDPFARTGGSDDEPPF